MTRIERGGCGVEVVQERPPASVEEQVGAHVVGDGEGRWEAGRQTVLPEDARTLPRPIIGYYGVLDERVDYQAIAALAELGIDRARIAVDPGIGFGKKDPHNLRLLDELAAFHAFGCPVMLGASRKSFIGRLSKGEAPKQRLAGTLAAHQIGFDRGVQIIRVHDVAEAFQARAIWLAAG